MKICIASGNRGKIAELQKLLSEYITDVEIELVSLKDVGFTGEIVEDGETFEENALIKARAASAFSGLPAIADDSGLIVNALNGEPGVYSARYAGEPCDDQKNNEKLLKNLEGIGDRSAAFVWVVEEWVMVRGESSTFLGMTLSSTAMPLRERASRV